MLDLQSLPDTVYGSSSSLILWSSFLQNMQRSSLGLADITCSSSPSKHAGMFVSSL